MATAVAFTVAPLPFSSLKLNQTNRTNSSSSSSLNPLSRFPSHSFFPANSLSLSLSTTNTGNHHGCFVVACLPSSTERRTQTPTNLYVSGLSFRTSEESLRNAFQNFGQLVQVNLVMDRIANRPRGFAFLQYATEEESKKAIEGMHGKFLDGRVIFVEVAKPRSEMRQGAKQNPRRY